MDRRTFLKRVGGTISGFMAGIGLLKSAKAEEPVELIMGIDCASGNSSCCVQLFGCDSDGNMELLETEFVPLQNWPPDWAELSLHFKEKPSRIIYERNHTRYDDHELHVKAYNDFVGARPITPAMRACCEAAEETLKEASENLFFKQERTEYESNRVANAGR